MPMAAMLAGDGARIAIGHHAVGRVGVVPEEVEGAALDVVEEEREARGRETVGGSTADAEFDAESAALVS